MIRPRLLLIPAVCAIVVGLTVLFAGWQKQSSWEHSANASRVRRQLQVLADTAELWRGKTGAYPSTLEELARMEREVNPNDFKRLWWGGPIVDPWGRPYLYEVSPSGLRIRTLGADGEEGGGGNDQDCSHPKFPGEVLPQLSPIAEYLASDFFKRALIPALLAGAAANLLCFASLWKYVRNPAKLGWGPVLGAAAVAILASVLAGWMLLTAVIVPSGH